MFDICEYVVHVCDDNDDNDDFIIGDDVVKILWNFERITVLNVIGMCCLREWPTSMDIMDTEKPKKTE